MGESTNPRGKLRFDRRIRLEFHGATITSDAGLLACRELDDALGLTKTASECLQESRGVGASWARQVLAKWGRWRPLVVVGGADGGPGQRRWGGVGGTACRGRQSRTGPVRLCGSVG